MSLALLIKESQTNREAWRYTNLTPFAKVEMGKAADYAMPELPAPLTRHRLVFVNGVYREDLSARQELPDEFFSRCDDCENCCALSLFGQTCLAVDPIELLFVNTKQQSPNEAETKIKISLGSNSRLTLIERHVGGGGDLHARHIRMEIDLAAQSKLVHGRIVVGGDSAVHFSKTDTKVAAGAFYDHFALICGGKLTRCEHDVVLQGKLAEARMLGVMLLDGTTHGDMTTLVRHLAPHGTSRQICKTVLKDKARGVFQGKVHVAKGAQKTDGYQLSRALLLSNQAEMDAKPELEIYADDVKCSHGTTIGDLDEQALFYMISRGIDPQTARAMLIEAFVEEIVDMCVSPDVVGVAKEEVGKWLAQK